MADECPLCGESLGAEKGVHARCADWENMLAAAADEGIHIPMMPPKRTPQIEARGRELEPVARRILVESATAAVVAMARELVAHAEGDIEPTVDGYDLDRLRKALAALDARKEPTDAL